MKDYVFMVERKEYFNNIKNFDISKKVIIAYGSAKFASGEICVPTSSTYI